MKSIFYFIALFFMLSCSEKVIVKDNVFNGKSIINTMNGKYSIAQFDSMCIADTLPNNLSEWIVLYTKDYETGEKIKLYSTYKNNVVYKVENANDDSIKIIKRISK